MTSFCSEPIRFNLLAYLLFVLMPIKYMATEGSSTNHEVVCYDIDPRSMYQETAVFPRYKVGEKV